MDAPWVGGVASGVAYRYDLSVGAVRLAFAGLAALGGMGVILYMWLWLTTPTEEEALASEESADTSGPFRSPMRAVGGRRDNEATVGRLLIAGSIFLGVAGLVALIGVVSGASGPVFFWLLVTLSGLVLVWIQAPKLAGKKNLGPIAFVVLGTLMTVLGVIVILYEMAAVKSLTAGMISAAATLLVASLALAPLGMRVVKDLTASREREAREVERADIAAHLHDSVLQTLTLIRGAAGDPARVRALALTQERELRSWLYTGQVEPETSLAEALNNQAAEVESTYGVPIDVVTVGDMWPGPRQIAAIAAATEAMTNAARHGAPPITVFQEARAGDLEIFVKDAGHGFDPERVPEDRHGLRNSIKGRVTRVGGTVNLRFLPKEDGGMLSQGDEPDGQGPGHSAAWNGAPRSGRGAEVLPSPPAIGGTEIRIFLPRRPDERLEPPSLARANHDVSAGESEPDPISPAGGI